MKIPLLDLQAQYQGLKHELNAAVAEVIESQRFILGPKVQECEKAIAEYSGCSFGVGVSSGSDALLICLMAEGIGPGDEVITTPFTFFATVGSTDSGARLRWRRLLRAAAALAASMIPLVDLPAGVIAS